MVITSLFLTDIIIAHHVRFVKGFGKIFYKNFAQKIVAKIVELVQIAQITRAWSVGARAKRNPLPASKGFWDGFRQPSTV